MLSERLTQYSELTERKLGELLSESELSQLYGMPLRRLQVQAGEYQQSTVFPLFGLRKQNCQCPHEISRRGITPASSPGTQRSFQ